MKKVFAVGLVVIVTGVFAYSFSTFFLRASINDPEVENANAIPAKPQKTMKAFASEAALKRGDVLTGVDGHSVQGLELNQAVDYILGQPGTPLRLNLVRDGRRGDVTLVRRKIAMRPRDSAS